MASIIAAGEYLLDLISLDYAEDFRSADRYRRLPGGSPANLAMNLSRLGVDAALLASVGRDDAGGLLVDTARAAGVDVSAVARVAEPTTLILVTKSREVSNFEPYRMADVQIHPEQLPTKLLADCEIFHTTAFALSKDPARATIVETARRAAAAGARLSIDANYAGKIWPDRIEALTVIGRYLSAADGSLAKFSEVDYHRLFGEEVTDPVAAVARIRELGAAVVCLTMGGEGCYVSANATAAPFHLPARPVEVKDTTGAGDAFWSAFLAAHLAGYDWPDCARAGRGMAERKLAFVGPLVKPPALETLRL